MRPMIAIATLAAVALAGCSAGSAAADFSDASRILASSSASSAPSPRAVTETYRSASAPPT